MSAYYMALEIRQTYQGMMVALPPTEWLAFRTLPATALAAVLRQVARAVVPVRYRKAHRGPKKPPPKRGKYHNGGHVSTHKLIQNRTQ